MNRPRKALIIIFGAFVALVVWWNVSFMRSLKNPRSVPPVNEEISVTLQPPPQRDEPRFGSFTKSPVTVVSGMWRIKGKRDFQEYLKWVRNFLQIDAHMVLFSDPATKEIIERFRPERFDRRTLWIELNISEFWTQRYHSDFAYHHRWLDPESDRHSIDLYHVWAEKLPMLKRAIEVNPFESSCYYWVDFGCFRDEELPRKYEHWPGSDRCLEDPRVIVLRTRKITEEETEGFKFFDIPRNFFGKINVGGGIYGGHRSFVLALHGTYFGTFEEWVKRKLFVGKDQNLLAVIGQLHPEIVQLIGPSPDNRWFYLQDYLL